MFYFPVSDIGLKAGGSQDWLPHRGRGSDHSERSAITGSTRIARRAGT